MDFDQIYALIIIPAFIFFARVSDVSIGTIRIVFVSKGLKYLAPILGFFEVFIWLLAMGKVMSNLDNLIYYVAYAGGFATGNYVGLLIEERLALGFVNLRIITQKDGSQLIRHLSSEGYGVTQIEAHGSQGKVHIIYCIIKRTEYKQVVEIISTHNPNAFFTIEDIRFINKGVHPNKSELRRPKNLMFLRWRLGK